MVLPLPFGTEKAEDLAAAHGQREVLDGVMVTEALVEAAHVDDDFIGVDRGCGVRHGAGSVTSTGWPGCNFAASAGAGFASTR